MTIQLDSSRKTPSLLDSENQPGPVGTYEETPSVEFGEVNGRRLSRAARILRDDQRSNTVLAEFAGVGSSSVGDWRTGKTRPDLRTRQQLEGRLQLYADEWELYTGRGIGEDGLGDELITSPLASWLNRVGYGDLAAHGFLPDASETDGLWGTARLELMRLASRDAVFCGFARPSAAGRKVCEAIRFARIGGPKGHGGWLHGPYPTECTGSLEGMTALTATLLALIAATEAHERLTPLGVPMLLGFFADYPEIGENQ